ncbi:TraB/GumN family protein [Polymorphobacter sp.]|uniref:TraB/GumN family protein n=1 Tax=Polymorphobacter sp. TaxID=1909290 RepID=UPI003F6EAF62
MHVRPIFTAALRLLVAATLAMPALAQAPQAAPQPAAPAAAAQTMPPAWVIRDADTEITLFATIHALPDNQRWLSPQVTQRFDTTDTLVLETMVPEDRFELAPLIQQLGIDAALPPLAARLSPASATAVARAAQEAGIPLVALDRMQPWLAALTLSEASLTRLGISAANGVEVALLARARTIKRDIVTLETPAQQIGFFAGLPQADQIAMLEATVADTVNARADVDRLVALWRAGDVDAIAREFAREARASPRLYEVLLAGRNRRWSEWLAGQMGRPGRQFVAVGAGHFGGPDGLLALLKARGYTAERLAPPRPAARRRR